MLIRCGKCGKMYDYDKYNGICHNCARYNDLEDLYGTGILNDNAEEFDCYLDE